jgi:hypothetical protein
MHLKVNLKEDVETRFLEVPKYCIAFYARGINSCIPNVVVVKMAFLKKSEKKISVS